MGTQEVSAWWLKAARSQKSADQVYGQIRRGDEDGGSEARK